MIEIKIIDAAHKDDINIPNEPFQLIGRVIPSYSDEQWNYSVRYFNEADITDVCFPDENYNYEEMKERSVFIGAYDSGKCVGLAILQDAWFQYMYLYDLKVSKNYRKKGIASAMMQKAKEVCKAHGYSGIYTQGQDNNLAACPFLHKNRFPYWRFGYECL